MRKISVVMRWRSADVTQDIFTFNRDPFAADSAITNLRLTNLDALAEVARRGGVPLTTRHSRKVLEGLKPRWSLAPVIQFRGIDQPNQRFRIEPVRADLVRMVAVHSG